MIASSIIAAVGLGVSAVGAYSAYENSKEAAGYQAQAAQSQAQIAALQAKNVDVQKQQLDLQSDQQLLQNKTQRDVIGQQAQADAIRQQASELDATRRRREAVRSGIVARANSLSAATNSGATNPGSTAVAQASASMSGQTNTNILGISQNLEFGQKLYDINKTISSIWMNASLQNDEFVGKSKTLQSQVLDTQKQIYALGGDASNSYANAAIAQGNAAFGQGIAGIGSALMTNAGSLGKMTNFFTTQQSGNSFNNAGTSVPGNLNYYG